MMPPASPHTAFQLNGAIQQPYQQAPGSAPASVAGSLAGIHIQAAEQQYVLVPRNMQAHSSNSTIGTTATQHQYPPLIETRRAA
jgi:hypothetical protein